MKTLALNKSVRIMLRYCTISLGIVLMTLNSAAQDYKDKFIINAAIGGYSLNKLDTDDYDYDEEKYKFSGLYNFSLKGGYFISNKTALGISSAYMYGQETDYPPGHDTVEVRSTINSFDIGPFYKGYFKLLKRFYFTFNVSPYYRHSSEKTSYPDEEFDSFCSIKEDALYISALPGLSFEVSNKFSIEFEMGFFDSYVRFKKILDSPVSKEKRKQVVYGTSTSLNEFTINDCLFGFTYRFNCK